MLMIDQNTNAIQVIDGVYQDKAGPGKFAAPRFAALTALYLDATDAYVTISASLRLRALHITADNLWVHFLLSCYPETPGKLVLERVLEGCEGSHCLLSAEMPLISVMLQYLAQ